MEHSVNKKHLDMKYLYIYISFKRDSIYSKIQTLLLDDAFHNGIVNVF